MGSFQTFRCTRVPFKEAQQNAELEPQQNGTSMQINSQVYWKSVLYLFTLRQVIYRVVLATGVVQFLWLRLQRLHGVCNNSLTVCKCSWLLLVQRRDRERKVGRDTSRCCRRRCASGHRPIWPRQFNSPRDPTPAPVAHSLVVHRRSDELLLVPNTSEREKICVTSRLDG
ncbi:hypothetical protein CBL_08127 [Carabus blaptoides fortunei]